MKMLLNWTIIVLLLAAAPVAPAQERIARLGYLSWNDSGHYHELTSKGFVAGLRDQGFVEGKNLVILRRTADHDPERFKPLARELAAAKVDVFFAPATPMATAAWYADHSTPIVIATVVDPIAQQFVKSLGRPGTRVTGVTVMNKELTAKRMQLLAEAVPGLKRVGVVVDEAKRNACAQEIDALNAAAKVLGLTLVYGLIDGPAAIDGAFHKLKATGVQAVMTTLTSTRSGLEKEYADAALKYRLPSMSELNYGADLGGLLSYGPDFGDVFRRAGQYAGRILKGAKPTDLPVQEPTRFELVVNLKTAKALGITLPPAIMVRADRVIE